MPTQIPFKIVFVAMCLIAARTLPSFADDQKNSGSSGLVTRSYDLRDLIIGSFVSTPLEAPELGKVYDTPPQILSPATDPQAVEDGLISRIQNAIERSTWASVPTMKFQDGVLIVQQTSDVQQRVAKLIDYMRRVPRPRVLVSAEFCKLIKPDPKNPFAAARAAAGGKVPTDSEVVRKLGEASENDPAIEVSHAQLEMVNFAGAYSLAGGSFRYIAEYTPVGSGQNMRFEPKYAYRLVGRLFEVHRAIVSADQKYVTLDIDADTSKLRWITNVPSKESPNLSIQSPMISTNQVRTRITVPVDGAMVIGALDNEFYTIVQVKLLPQTQMTDAN